MGKKRRSYFFFQEEDGIRDLTVTGVQTCALPIWMTSLAGLERRALSGGGGCVVVSASAAGREYVRTAPSGTLSARTALLGALAIPCWARNRYAGRGLNRAAPPGIAPPVRAGPCSCSSGETSSRIHTPRP